MNAEPLSLSSPRWKQLQQAYGPAEDTPKLLMKIIAANAKDKSDWLDLWSSICHQDTVYSATFAAIPHLVEAIRSSREPSSRLDVYHIVAYSHLCAAESGVRPDEDLRVAYENAVGKCLKLAIQDLEFQWSALDFRALVGCILALKGDLKLSRLLFNVDSEELDGLLELVQNLNLPSNRQ